MKAEALTQLIAGSDTTGNTITHVVDVLCRYPEAAKKLQEELDQAFPNVHNEPGWVASFDDCKDLPYTQGILYETLRLRTTVSVGLPRVVPKGGATVCGRFFEAGTTLSTPTYTTHRDVRVWGPDAREFKPERWQREGAANLEKAFLGFSYGPRACIGRNVSLSLSPPLLSFLARTFPCPGYHRVKARTETNLCTFCADNTCLVRRSRSWSSKRHWQPRSGFSSTATSFPRRSPTSVKDST